MERLIEEEEDQRKSILFASKLVIIRNNTLFIISKIIKAGFPLQVLEKDCNIIFRLLQDFAKPRDNWIMFENMVAALNSIEVDQSFTCEVLQQHF